MQLVVSVAKLCAQTLHGKRTSTGQLATNRGRFVSLHSLPLPEVIRSVVFLSSLLCFISFIVFVIVLCIFFLLSVRI